MLTVSMDIRHDVIETHSSQAHSAALEKERKRGEELREKAVRSAEGEWTAAKAEMLMEVR